MVYLRSYLFALGLWAITIVYGIISLFVWPLTLPRRYRIISGWGRGVTWLSVHVLGIRFRVIGAEHIPTDSPMVIIAKHQSAWETIVFSTIFPPHVWVLKRELLRLPFFGWGLAVLSPVAIDRSAGRASLKQVLLQGKDRLRQGMSLLVFPEGTRVAPGKRKGFQQGGAAVAISAKVPVVPVAHNAGECWGRNAWIKYPGTVTVVIGEAIPTEGRSAVELTREVEDWVTARMAEIEGSARSK